MYFFVEIKNKLPDEETRYSQKLWLIMIEISGAFFLVNNNIPHKVGILDFALSKLPDLENLIFDKDSNLNVQKWDILKVDIEKKIIVKMTPQEFKKNYRNNLYNYKNGD